MEVNESSIQPSVFESSDNLDKIAKALLTAQKNMGAAVKGSKNPFFKSKYADIGSVLEAVKAPLNNAGIIILQPVVTFGGEEYVKTVLLHESGQFVSSAVKLILGKKDMQGALSAVTYARRGGLQALVALPAEDDDGESNALRTKTTFSKESKKTAPIKKEKVEPKKEEGISFRKRTKHTI